MAHISRRIAKREWLRVVDHQGTKHLLRASSVIGVAPAPGGQLTEIRCVDGSIYEVRETFDVVTAVLTREDVAEEPPAWGGREPEPS